MKLRLKITAFVLSCFLLQGQCVHAEAMSSPDATKKLTETMGHLARILEEHGYSFETFIAYLNGNESNKKADRLEVEVKLGETPVIVVEEKDGKLNVLSSREAKYEDGVDLTNDNTHQAIVAKLKAKPGESVVHNYQDKTGNFFRVLAYPISLLEEKQDPAKRTSGFIYAATETQITSEAAGAVAVPATKK